MMGTKGRSLRSVIIQGFIGVVCGAALLWLSFRKVGLGNVADTLLAIDLAWVAAAMAAYGMALSLRTIRWWVILRPVARIRLHQVGAALLLGYGLNALIPARLGELMRADYCGRRYGLSRSTVFGTILIERFSDGVIVLCALMLGLSFIHTDDRTLAILHSFVVTGLAVFGVFGFLMLASGRAPRLLRRFPFVAQKLTSLSESLALLRSATMVEVVSLSVVVWLADGTALWAILRACGAPLTFVPMLVVIGIVSLASLLPSPPGFIGTMQFSFALSVSLVNGTASRGVAAATANQLFLILPLILCAFFLWIWLSWRSHKNLPRHAPDRHEQHALPLTDES